ncbi:metallophosphoesterase [Microbacterium sp.]|uniref:metallophosphoesterase n=1 Tax=Microbacterium sp. TaxID=51671 RepID=UPI003C78DF00
MTVLEVPPGGRVAVIGDLSGHADALRAELARLGVPEGGAGRIPSDLRIVQVGDLVHRGPDSAGVVALVDRHLRDTPGRWVQLVGNHDGYYVRRRQFTWDERVPSRTAATLRRWWSEGAMRAAVAIRGADEWFVVTHAGVTRGFWSEILGAPADAVGTADAINALMRTKPRVLFRPGVLVGYRRPSMSAGPIWAAAGTELLASWLDHELPFSQVHGHTSIYDWDSGSWYADPAARSLAILDESAKHVAVTLPGGRLVSVDPCHDAIARHDWRSFELSGPTCGGAAST